MSIERECEILNVCPLSIPMVATYSAKVDVVAYTVDVAALALVRFTDLGNTAICPVDGFGNLLPREDDEGAELMGVSYKREDG